MGGYGSGRTNGRPLADSALFIDIAWMLSTGRAVEGEHVLGSLRWTRGGEPSGWIGYSCDMRDDRVALLKLDYTVAVRATGEKHSYAQDVPLSFTRPHFGGKRWWMHCPVSGERVGKLYCPSGGHTFAGRKTWGLAYQSQRIAERDRPFENLFRLQKKLGCEQGFELPIKRPKGMWRRTFARHQQTYAALDAMCCREFDRLELAMLKYL